MTDLLTDATIALYSGPPEEFMARRKELSTAAKDAGDAAAAKAVTALRKPTAAAAAVNQFVHGRPEAVDQLLDVGDRMRSAHEALDVGLLRELSDERRALVAELTAAALAGTESPSVALRDDVSNTFDAAVADPGIAARLGRLVRPERWSGFGFAPGGTPELTLLRGGRDTSGPRGRAAGVRSSGSGSSRPAKPAPAKSSPAERRRGRRAVEKAQAAFDAAEQALAAADAAEQETVEQVHSLGAQIADLSAELDRAKRDLDRLRRDAKGARARRREARSALDRAERNSPD